MPPIPRFARVPAALFAIAIVLVAPQIVSADSASAPAGPFLFTDANGSIHMVQTFDEVPASARATLRTLGGDKVEYQSRVSTMTKRRAARARAAAAKLAKVPERQRDPVILYSASWCGYCTKTRRFLVKRGIAFEERDIDQPRFRAELKRKTGSAMVPVVQSEDQLIIGWNPRALASLRR